MGLRIALIYGAVAFLVLAQGATLFLMLTYRAALCAFQCSCVILGVLSRGYIVLGARLGGCTVCLLMGLYRSWCTYKGLHHSRHSPVGLRLLLTHRAALFLVLAHGATLFLVLACGAAPCALPWGCVVLGACLLGCALRSPTGMRCSWCSLAGLYHALAHVGCVVLGAYLWTRPRRVWPPLGIPIKHAAGTLAHGTAWPTSCARP